MATHNELGKEGEEESVRFLIEKGYIIHHRNWRSGKYELDIIAQQNDELVIVEVKTRRNTLFGTPESAINNQKIRRILSSTVISGCRDTYSVVISEPAEFSG